jgi:hypothetical protein
MTNAIQNSLPAAIHGLLLCGSNETVRSMSINGKWCIDGSFTACLGPEDGTERTAD